MKARISSILLIIMASVGCHDNFEPETLVLPYGYEGWVGVAYGIPQGSGVNEQEDRLIYRLPEDGIFITNRPFNSGVAERGDLRFVYQSNGQNAEEIPLAIGKDMDTLDQDSVYVLSISTIGIDVSDEDVEWDGGVIYAIGRPALVDSLSNSKMHFIDRMYEVASVQRD